MRPTNKPNSYLRNPLDQILGYPANIQVLRILVETGRGMSVSEIANGTGLSVPGVHKVIFRLLKAGVLIQEGSGRAQLVLLRSEHPLSVPLTEIFQVEKNNFESLKKKLTKVVENLEIKPKSVWIYSKVAKGTDDYGDPVRIALLGEISSVDEMTERFRQKLYESNIEKEFDVTIEVRGITLADKEVMNTLPVILLWGPDPQFYFVNSKDDRDRGQSKSHRDLDSRSLNDADVWVNFLKAHPEVIERTKSYLDDMIQTEKSGIRNELIEWYRLLESMSFQRLKKFLQSDSERSTRLRQSLPFWPVLTESERKKFKSIAQK